MTSGCSSKSDKKIAAVVLGMHRSGTSAIAGLLNMLRVQLGHNLMGPSPDNVRGYWENIDIVNFNEEILDRCERRWDSTDWIEDDTFSNQCWNSYRQRAGILLATTFSDSDLIGLKDPRMSQLLTFWKRVFQETGYKPRYIVSIRHPDAVAASLRKRDGFAEIKSHQLWLNHYYLLLRHVSSPLLVVDYESLVNNPEHQLERIAAHLGIERESIEDSTRVLARAYIDRKLDHSGPIERVVGRSSSEEAPELYRRLSEHADGEALLPRQIQEIFEQADLREARITRDGYYLSQIEKLEALRNQARFEKAQLEEELERVRQDRVRVDEDRHKIDVERLRLRGVVKSLEHDVERLSESNLAREAEIRRLRGELEWAHTEIGHWQAEVTLIRKSRSWKLTEPLRRVSTIASAIKAEIPMTAQRLTVRPICGVKALGGAQWEAVDGDPQFMLLNENLNRFVGWCRLKVAIEAADSVLVRPEVYLDYGDGFTARNCVKLNCIARNHPTMLRLSKPIVALRIDPISSEGRFVIGKASIRRVTKAEALLAAAKFVYQKNRGRGQSFGAILRDKLRQVRETGVYNVIKNLDLYVTYEEVAAEYATSDVVHYEGWIERVEARYGEELLAVESRPSDGVHNFLVADDGCDLELLLRTLASIIDQSDHYWHLYLVVNQFSKEEIVSRLEVSDSVSRRITVMDGRGRPLQDVLKEADTQYTGDMVTLVHGGDVLASFFTAALREELRTHASAEIVYSDHDTVNGKGERCAPAFKPDWNPDYLRATNYIGETVTFRRSLLNSLDASEQIEANTLVYRILLKQTSARIARVAHIPYILYHQTIGSTESSFKLTEAQVALLGKHVRDTCGPAEVLWDEDENVARIQYPLPDMEPKVCLIIPTRDQAHLLQTCIESIINKTNYGNYDIFIVDNQSREAETIRYLKELGASPKFRILQFNQPFNYAAINNFAVRHSDAPIIGLVNNDVEVLSPDWLREMVSHALRPEIGCVGAKLYYPDGRIQHAGVILGIQGVAAHGHAFFEHDEPGYQGRLRTIQNYSAVTGACLIVRRDLFNQVGGLDERLRIAFNDVDFCLKIREAGYRNLWTPYAELYHHESVSRGPEGSHDNVQRLAEEARYMKLRWGDLLINDPTYNPHLTLTQTNFETSLRQVNQDFALRRGGLDINPAQEPFALESNFERAGNIVNSTAKIDDEAPHYSPGLSIVILTLEKLELIEPLLRDLVDAKKKLKYESSLDVQIIVGDTGSKAPGVHALYESLRAEITVENDMLYHFSRCNNILFEKYVRLASVLFLNNDVTFENASRSLLLMYEALRNDKMVGVVGSYLVYPSKKLQHGGIKIFSEGDLEGLCYHPGHHGEFSPLAIGVSQSISAVTGACLMVDSALFRGLMSFDESYETECQDVDLCLKARRAGKDVKVIYAGELVHIENATRDRSVECNNKDRSRFIRKWANYCKVFER